MADDSEFGEAILLKELGWSHGELTPSIVHQALAEVRHRTKEVARLTGELLAAQNRAINNDAEAALIETERDRLLVRQQELLATIVRVTNETPFPDEIKGWEAQRAAMIATIGTLRAALHEACSIATTPLPEDRQRILSLDRMSMEKP